MKTRTRRSTKRQSPSKEDCSPSRAPLLPHLPPAPALSLFIPLHAPAAISLFCSSTCSRGGRARYSYPSPELSVATPSWFLVPLFLFPLSFPLLPFPLFFFSLSLSFPPQWVVSRGWGVQARAHPCVPHSPASCSVSPQVGFVGIFSISFCLLP